SHGVDEVAGARDRPAPLVVRDARSGASFEVPATDWRVEDRDVRIYYADDAGRPVAVVRGPAVFRSGYCAERPRDSNRGFAGFTRQGFRAWVGGITHGRGTWTTGTSHERIRLADGTTGRLTRLGLALDRGGPCAALGVEVAMVESGGVRVVLVRDTAVDDELPTDDVEEVLASLRLGSAD
ncbi:hypothetical protein, partial [Nocardioides sp.]|uniref:hypothetical protein n=1 Tax=Nocardioides sp. TaxID=35761 RepID=UPI002ED9942D